VATTISLLLLWWVVSHRQFVADAGVLDAPTNTRDIRLSAYHRRSSGGCQVHSTISLTYSVNGQRAVQLQSQLLLPARAGLLWLRYSGLLFRCSGSTRQQQLRTS
jgi:hypothetical protein